MSKQWDYLYDCHLFGHKYFEVQLGKWDDIDTNVRFSLTTKGDHAGIRFGIQIRRHMFHIDVYDDRHWNYEEDRWEVYEEGR